MKIRKLTERIFEIRNMRVMLDADLAELYGVETKRLNEQVKRNRVRFPRDFMIQLTAEEKLEVVAICDHLGGLKYSPVLPYAFSEHGAIMLASVLNSSTAVRASIEVVRSFVRLRMLLQDHQVLVKRLIALEDKCDSQFKSVFSALREILNPTSTGKKRLGIRVDD